MPHRSTRRTFIKQVAVGGLAVPLFLPRISRANPANSRLNHASIGVGGMMGLRDAQSIFSSERVNLAAICDVDTRSLAKAAEKFPDARQYRDWREMLATEGDRIDSINITTPDHMHAPIAVTAMNMGKHVYCQKPIAQTVREARVMSQTAARTGVVTQMGNQIQSHVAYRSAVQMIRDGAIGRIKSFHSWSAAPGGLYDAPLHRPDDEDQVPAHLDWDLWIGVAPWRPYKDKIYHTVKWRGWKDFGGGAMGDFGCHIFDPIFTALNLGAPISIRAEVPHVAPEGWPAWQILHYVFPGNDMTVDATLKGVWYDGGKKPDRALALLPEDRDLPGSGSLIIGEEGQMLLPHVGGPQLLPAEQFAEYPRQRLEHIDHYHSFVRACLGEGNTSSHFGYAGPLTEAVQLGNIANHFPEQTLQWDSESFAFTNFADADKLLGRSYRQGWEVAGL